mmetsp:Transcript_4188/g.15366  ORF Transcript_4188/g.15366 Transcript_4188/m.15366 type:complete len:221 (+) Transcript_4188:3951-4613(+)
MKNNSRQYAAPYAFTLPFATNNSRGWVLSAMNRRKPPSTTAGRNCTRSLSSLKKLPVKTVAPKHCHSGLTTAGRNGVLCGDFLVFFAPAPFAAVHSFCFVRRSLSPRSASLSFTSNCALFEDARYSIGRGNKSSISNVRSPPSFKNGVTQRYKALPIRPCCALDENVVPPAADDASDFGDVGDDGTLVNHTRLPAGFCASGAAVVVMVLARARRCVWRLW